MENVCVNGDEFQQGILQMGVSMKTTTVSDNVERGQMRDGSAPGRIELQVSLPNNKLGDFVQLFAPAERVCVAKGDGLGTTFYGVARDALEAAIAQAPEYQDGDTPRWCEEVDGGWRTSSRHHKAVVGALRASGWEVAEGVVPQVGIEDIVVPSWHDADNTLVQLLTQLADLRVGIVVRSEHRVEPLQARLQRIAGRDMLEPPEPIWEVDCSVLQPASHCFIVLDEEADFWPYDLNVVIYLGLNTLLYTHGRRMIPKYGEGRLREIVIRVPTSDDPHAEEAVHAGLQAQSYEFFKQKKWTDECQHAVFLPVPGGESLMGTVAQLADAIVRGNQEVLEAYDVADSRVCGTVGILVDTLAQARQLQAELPEWRVADDDERVFEAFDRLIFTPDYSDCIDVDVILHATTDDGAEKESSFAVIDQPMVHVEFYGPDLGPLHPRVQARIAAYRQHDTVTTFKVPTATTWTVGF